MTVEGENEMPLLGARSSQGLSSRMINTMGMAVTADSTIMEVLQAKPDAANVLFRFGMGCLGCAVARGETVREAAMAHGIPLEELLAALEIPEK
jgi:hybrid cluster-associated redox disulfide protein